ncbi:MAG: thiol:disulfide interchange protein [Chloroflexi bacterium HGW-Chloroflexi-9]|nr:MAG: thiol:disulfide interchange protein [Chloroflexi bacterium HGW-Chloroflexi-9]
MEPVKTRIGRLLRACALAGVVLGTGALVSACSAEAGAEIGQRAPDFSLVRADTGETLSLSDLRGKTVIVNFWATWCPPCRAEMPDLQGAYDERLAAGDLVILGVNEEEGAEQVQRFIAEFGLTFPVVLDKDAAVRRRYNVPGLPATFFIDRDGIIRARSYGPVFGNLLPDGIAAADRGGES